MNCGYFSNFTVFLELSSPEFANRYLRSEPLEQGLFTLGGYLSFWGFMYIAVTGLLYFIPEEPYHLRKNKPAKLSSDYLKEDDHYNKSKGMSQYLTHLKGVYSSMIEVLKLPNVQLFVVILLIAKLGFQVNESATNLKLLEKGLSKEDKNLSYI